MNAVDVTLMTSRLGGSPVAVRESLACETPVVSVAVGDVPEVLAGLSGCAVVQPRPDERARGVLRRPASPAAARLLRAARRGVLARAHGLKVLDVYEQALRRHDEPSPLHGRARPVSGRRAAGRARGACRPRRRMARSTSLAMRRPGEPPEEQVDGVAGPAPAGRAPARGGVPATVLREYVGLRLRPQRELAGRRATTSSRYTRPPDFLIAAALVPRRARRARRSSTSTTCPSDMFAMRFGDRPGAPLAERLLRLVETDGRRGSPTRSSPCTSPTGAELERRGVPRAEARRADEQRRRVAAAGAGPHAPRRPGLSASSTTGRSRPPYGVDLLVSAAAKAARADAGASRSRSTARATACPASSRLAAEVGLDRIGCHAYGRYLPHREVLSAIVRRRASASFRTGRRASTVSHSRRSSSSTSRSASPSPSPTFRRFAPTSPTTRCASSGPATTRR